LKENKLPENTIFWRKRWFTAKGKNACSWKNGKTHGVFNTVKNQDPEWG